MTTLPAGVAAGHVATAAVGAGVLRAGGSAGDAGAAMILAGCVAETIFTGLGGGGFATVFEAATGAVHCLDFFVAVPGLDGSVAAAPRNISVLFSGIAVPYAVGGASVAVPGTPAGVAELHRRFGRLPWSEIVRPARDLAVVGAPFSQPHADLLPEVAEAMVLGAGVAAYARPDGRGGQRTLTAGELLVHDGLADALDDYLEHGPAILQTGVRGRALVAAVRADGGALSELDMAEYRVKDLPVRSERLGPGTVHVRGNDLDRYADSVAALDTAAIARGGLSRAQAFLRAIRSPAHRSETTSLVAVDHDQNVCVATHSLGLGSGVWTGGVHGNSMLGEGELLRSPLVPGERMPSMMVPQVITDDAGRVLAAGGAAGGSRIRSALLQVLAGVLVEGRGSAEAVVAPRLATTTGTVHLEPGFDPAVIAGLEAAGEQLVQWDHPRPFFGGVSLASASGLAADPRRGGDAIAC